jgi:hypothetical protein
MSEPIRLTLGKRRLSSKSGAFLTINAYHPEVWIYKNIERIAAHEKTVRDGLEEGMRLIIPE